MSNNVAGRMSGEEAKMNRDRICRSNLCSGKVVSKSIEKNDDHSQRDKGRDFEER